MAFKENTFFVPSNYLNQLEQLERLRSENTPHRPMITHTIDSYQFPSKKNMERT